uniref:Uncharacterized protein n=1 Tax=Rhizophora mucronata TaxID=61149 RepID=A0A2P2Q540_RHIMU
MEFTQQNTKPQCEIYSYSFHNYFKNVKNYYIVVIL